MDIKQKVLTYISWVFQTEDGEEAISKVTTSENLPELWNNRSYKMPSLHKYQVV